MSANLLHSNLFPPLSISKLKIRAATSVFSNDSSHKPNNLTTNQTIKARSTNNGDAIIIAEYVDCYWPKRLLSLAVAVALITPLPCSAIPSLNSKSLSLPPSTTTPFSQAQKLPTGLENGKIRACPSINPSCVSSNPRSSNFQFPWSILDKSSTDDAIQQLQRAISKTQKNAKIQLVQETPNGTYLQAEVDGGFGRDLLEFLVNGDIVSYRAMATKVTYVYPFTTAFGDSKGQEQRMKQIIDELGWYAPSFESMD